MRAAPCIVVTGLMGLLLVACGGTEAVPANLDAVAIDKHCADMAKRYDEFQKTYAVPAATFFQALRPAGLSTTVVYPFGGGDLASVLVTYPDARDITTISLEATGDVEDSSAVEGLSAIKTPTNPTPTASQRNGATVSPSNMAERAVTIRGVAM